jgi:peptide/nickel transport system permease protein
VTLPAPAADTAARAVPAGEPRRAGEGRWASFAWKRARRLLASVWVLVTAAFLMIHLVPGDPARASLGMTASPALVESIRDSLGLDRPIWVQYWDYLTGLFRGDLGVSIMSRLPVADVIGVRLPNTALLAVLAFAAAIAVAVPTGTGMAVATRHGRRRFLELGFAGTSVIIAAIPDFLAGVALVWVFSVNWHLLPVGGAAGAASFVLPVLSLAIGPAAVLARIVRVELLAVLDADYVRTARMKRLSAARVTLAHALPNALTASLTLSGLLLGSMVAGTVLVESVFAWPGLGSTIVQSILMKDYPLVQGIILVYGAGVLLINTAVDVALFAIDPRSAVGEA